LALDSTKYRLSPLALFAVGGGYVTASGRQVDAVGAAFAALGAALSAFGASALNMVMEREFDARMDRTRDRPVASGEVSPRAAVVFGVLLLSGLGILALETTRAAAGVSAAVALIYLWA
jgi:protoheme IX farnesyltransferase